MKTTYETTWGASKITISADFSQASSIVEGLELPRQVADFSHSPRRAMEAALTECAMAEGILNDDGTDDLIAKSLGEMVRVEDAVEVND